MIIRESLSERERKAWSATINRVRGSNPLLATALLLEYAQLSRTPRVAVDIDLPPTWEQLVRRIREMPHPNVRVAIQPAEDSREGPSDARLP